MDHTYLGVLEPAEPLHDYLTDLLQNPVTEPVFEMHRLHPDMLMVRYTERSSQTQFACKFYGRKLPKHREPSAEYFREQLHEECSRMREVRALGFDRPPYRVPALLAVNEDLEYMLVEEFVPGPNLSHFIHAAYERGEVEALVARLGDLARFLASLHSLSQSTRRVEAQKSLDKLAEIIEQAEEAVPTDAHQDALDDLVQRWHDVTALGEAPEVLLHGDSTPVNFIFPAPGEVVAIDLERCQPGDGMQDVGSIEAELVSAGLRMAGRAYPEHLAAFRQAYSDSVEPGLHKRGLFWRGLYLLRISRNDWLEEDHRGQLVKEAIQCLRS